MVDRRARMLGIALVTLIMVVSSLGLLAAVAPAGGHSAASTAVSIASAAHPQASVPRVTSPGADAALPSALSPSTTVTATNPVATRALAQAAAAGVPSRDVFVPRASASPTQLTQAHAQGHVTPLYGGNTPAPLGLGYYGLSASPNGSVVPTILNAPSVFATFDPNATGVVPNYPFSSSTDAYGVQLNAVTTSINLLGNSSYQFWTQNVAEFYPSQGTLYLVTNVWNFTGPSLSTNAIYSHGPHGVQVGTTFYYSEILLQNVHYPFNLDLWMNNSVTAGGRNNVSFTVGLAQGAGFSNYTSYPYDWVDFNSTSATLSQYTANGETYNPFGLTNDFEVILGGPGGGAQADLFAADATMTLQYWNTTTGSYQMVPAAYSYGGETGETVTGANVAWDANATTGAPLGVVTTGAGFLYGLWNATTSSGVTPVKVNVNPTNAFIFMAPNASSNFSYRGALDWAPQELNGGQFYLAPGAYNLSVALSGYTPVNLAFTVTAGLPATLYVNLTANATIGIYTPLYVWNNNQFAGISTGGAGTAASPYLIMNAQTYLMPALFGFFNDYTFPVYYGVFLWGTNASVELNNMPSMVSASPFYDPATGQAWPSNDLGYEFEGTSNVALVNSTQIGGWYTANVYFPFAPDPFVGNYYGTFSVQTWDATNTLIAGNTFLTQAAGLSMDGGTANTVWGNTFTMVPQTTLPGSPPFPTLNLSLGLQETEGGDLIYNNVFDTTTTAVGAPIDLYSGSIVFFHSTWNITPVAGSVVNYASGFPWFPLTGTIIGNATQGGNYWWDYGSTDNPVGVYPYAEYNSTLGVNQIYVGGDYYPLVPQNYSVTFTESGLASGTSWTVDFAGTAHSSLSTTITLYEVNGSYSFSIPNVGSDLATPSSGTVTVAGLAVNVNVVFAPPTPYAVTFTESGLPSGTQWGLTVGGSPYTTATTQIAVMLVNGTYSYSINVASGYTPSPAIGQVTVNGAPVNVGVTYSPPATYSVTFSESGLPSGTNWSVTFNGVVGYSTTSSIVFTVPSNSYLYSVGAVSGYTASPASGTVTVSGASTSVSIAFSSTGPTTYALSFTETGLPSGTTWSVSLQGGATLSGATPTLSTMVANGTYTYSVGSVTGYTSLPTTSSVTVNGAAQSASITFSAVPTNFLVEFAEVGLPAGTTWSVTLGSHTNQSSTPVITFTVPNGQYSYQIGNVSGYVSSITSESPSSPLTVSGVPVVVGVDFSSAPSTGGSSGLSTLDWILIGVVIAIVIIGLVAALAMRGRGGSGSKASATTQGASSPEAPEGETSEGSGGSSR